MTSPSPTAATVQKPSLRQRTTRGILWVAVQAIATRGSTALQQLALGWLLLPDDFGLIGLTYTVTMFVNLVANPGIDTILVQRQRRFKLWATPACWMGVAASIVAMLLLVALAPIATRVYEKPLTGLITVLAIAIPFQSLQIVTRAQLQMQMRFRAVAMLGMLNNGLIAVLTVTAAYAGMGAYSFVVPVPIVAAIVAFANWKLTHPPVRLRPEFGRWRFLIGSSLTLFTTQLLFVFQNQADYIALGLARLPDAAIGTYVFAFSVAVQSLRLLSSSVMVVLFPSLSQLASDPEKQVRAALRAMRLLMLVGVPFCLLQVVMTEPAFRLAQLLPKWNEAVLPCQILTIGLMVNAACWPAASLFNAQGRFRTQFLVTLGASLAFAAILAIALLYRQSILSVAVGVAIWHCFHSPIFHATAFWKRAPIGSFFREFGPPLAAGLVAAAATLWLLRFVPATVIGDIVALSLGSAVFASIYMLVVYLIVPASLKDLGQQLLPLWHRLRGKPATAADVAVEAALVEASEAAIASDGDKLP